MRYEAVLNIPSREQDELTRLRQDVLSWVQTRPSATPTQRAQVRRATWSKPTRPSRSHAAGRAGRLVYGHGRYFLVSGVVLLLVLVGLIFGVYANLLSTSVTLAVTRALPLPAAIINGRLIFASSVVEDQLAFERQSALLDSPTELRSQLLEAHIDQMVLRQLARRYGIRAEIIDQSVQTSELSGTGKSTLVIAGQLATALTLDERYNREALARARALAAQAAANPNGFAELARSQSQDASAQTGGELGFIRRGQLPTELEAAAFSLTVGEVSSVVVSASGFHILQAQEVLRDDAGQPLSVRLRQIYIKAKNPAEILEQVKQQSLIWRFFK